jgi:hypothetical protein
MIEINIEENGKFISDQEFYNKMPVEIFNKYKYFKKAKFLDINLEPAKTYRLNRLPLKFFELNEIYRGQWTPIGKRNGLGEFLVNEKCLFLGYWNDDDFYYGMKIYENGSYYIGDFFNFFLHGEGKFYDKDNNLIYEGSFKKDKFHGKGKLTAKLKSPFLFSFSKFKFPSEKIKSKRGFSFVIKDDNNQLNENNNLLNNVEKEIEDNKTININGNFEDNKINGRAILEIEDYFKYDGEFLFNKFDGLGKISFLNKNFSSSQYIGEFQNNCLHGKGIFSWKSGAYYEGNFLNNKNNGHGVHNIDKDISIEGNWTNGIINGKCLLNDKANDIYIKNLLFKHGKLLNKNENENEENSKELNDDLEDFDLKGFNNIEDLIMSSNINNEYNFTKENFELFYLIPEIFKINLADENFTKKINIKRNGLSLSKTEKEIAMLVK